MFVSCADRVASEDYECYACSILNNDNIHAWGLSFKEYRSYIQAKRNSFKIKKGDSYIDIVCREGGTLVHYRSIPKINDICNRVDAYDYYTE